MLNTKEIGNKIAEARKKINISQAQLAQRLFISSQAVGKWERGESMPDITTFNRLAEILGVDLNYFSENFQSPPTEIAPVESLVKQTVGSTSGKENQVGKAGNKLSWDMSRGNWVDADFSGLKNLHEKFSSSNMQRCKFIGSDLSGLLLKNNNVDSCDFSGSDISKSHIQDSNLGNNVFKDCKLKETEFSESNIENCDFSGVDFTGTKFSKSYIYGCDFTGADFTGVVIKSGGFTGVVVKSGDFGKKTIAKAVWNRTSFIDTQVANIVFTGTLDDCYFENCAFTRVTFQNVTLSNTFFKNNKKLKRIRFIDCRADRMTYEFLKQGKADLTGITLISQKGGNE
ncbi:MAG: transcriptional regulator [Bacteroidetes bacterium GWC2_33_15]|nr:MAG: transcriptional regulator [Bacteroidetes bacterium GWA2_33_15]OFX52095.1 MAG: transcriptional regulator [Bacteroidetes bacterium GWC2_33_15]OFX64249.1 MAG: transcriptional regulator [Bacteroidetes bacterium GWB2_32_14]OFX67654.1 MAG: transcriptional regulator [Bacteroidetes bacterium GWD2_33_33]HAN19259.1 transcriptional regulator [Bacteroidales bacterium]